MMTKKDQALVILRICKRAGWNYASTLDRMQRVLKLHPMTVSYFMHHSEESLHAERT